MFLNSDQLKSYMKKMSEETGISIQNCYNTFFARSLLSRLGQVSYGELILKGSFSQMVHMGEMIRPVTDIDLISTTKDKNETLIMLFNAFYEEHPEDGIHFDLTSLPKTTRTGIIKIPIVAMFDKIKHSINIDFDPGVKSVLETHYNVVPRVFTEDKRFYINTPSYEETLAEKLCIVVESNKNDVLNTRIKDFYDIYKMHNGKYDLEKFSHYFKVLLNKRGKISEDEVSVEHLNKEFLENHRDLWDAMSKKYEFLDKTIEFDEALFYTKGVISEQIQKVKAKKIYMGDIPR